LLTAEGVERGLHDAGQRRDVEQVGRVQRRRARARGVELIGQRRRRHARGAVVDQYLRAVRVQGTHDGGAEPARATGDERDLAAQRWVSGLHAARISDLRARGMRARRAAGRAAQRGGAARRC
jgi:hypothetical protein